MARYQIDSVRLSLTVLDCLARLGTGRPTEIAEETDIPTSTVHKHLRSLTELGVVYERDAEYRISASVFSYSDGAKRGLDHFETVVLEIELAKDVTEGALFYFVAEGEQCVCVHSTGIDGQYAPGDALAMTSAPGRAMLSTYSTEALEELDIDSNGNWNLDEEFHDDPDGTVAVPIVDPGGRCLGAVAVHSAARMQVSARLGDVAGQLKGIQNAIRSAIA